MRGSGSNSNGGSIPASSKKMIQSLKEIVNNPDVEIYAMLKECNMDPNEAITRLITQDPFHEVKSKREKKKENKDASDSRFRSPSSSSNRGGRSVADRNSSRGSSAQFATTDSASSRGKSTYKKDNGQSVYSSSATVIAGNNESRREPLAGDFTTEKTSSIHAPGSVSAVLPSSGFQSAWGGMAGQRSMADIVKMGRPHEKTSNNISSSHQHVMVSPGVPGPHDLPPSENYAFKGSDVNSYLHVPPNDDWPLDEEPPAISVSSAVEPSAEGEPYADLYDGRKHQFRSPSDEVRFVEDDDSDNAHSNFVQFCAESNQNVHEENSGNASGFDDDFYQNNLLYQIHQQQVEEPSVTVSSVTSNFQKLSLPKEDEDPPSEDDGPAVKIPDHLQVQSAHCSHLSFGSFVSGKTAEPVASTPVKINDEEASVAADAQFVRHPEASNPEYYEDEHLNSVSEGIDADTGNFDTPSVSQPDMSQQDMLKQETPEVALGNHYSFPSTTNYAFENSNRQQLNASFAHSSAGSEMQGLPPLTGVMPYSNSLPSPLLASKQQPLRESELAYSPFPISQSMPTKYSNSVSSINDPSASITEAMKTGNFSATQPTQTSQGGGVSGGHALQQQLLHPYSQHSVPMGAFAPTMVSYPFMPQNYPYMPSAFQQAFAASNSNYPQSLAAMLPQYKNSIAVSSLPQSAAVASGYGAAFGNSNSLPSNFQLNAPAAPVGTFMSYDDVLSSQYKDASLLSLQQGPGSRTMSGVPGSTYYSFQGQQSQQPAGFRQSQQPSQHYGPLSSYPNYYHSQGGPTLEQQLQMSRDGSLGGTQSQQPKQTAQQLWQNTY